LSRSSDSPKPAVSLRRWFTVRDDTRVMQSQIDNLMSGYRELRHNLALMQQEILEVRETAYSEDGLVVVTVGPRGHLLGVRIDPLVNRRPNTDELSASILEATRTAVEQAGDAVAEISAKYAPAGINHEELGDFDFSSLFSRHDAELTEGEVARHG
jgi:DNA-binding protein YbaB